MCKKAQKYKCEMKPAGKVQTNFPQEAGCLLTTIETPVYKTSSEVPSCVKNKKETHISTVITSPSITYDDATKVKINLRYSLIF
jgi:hypothetical protein